MGFYYELERKELALANLFALLYLHTIEVVDRSWIFSVHNFYLFIKRRAVKKKKERGEGECTKIMQINVKRKSAKKRATRRLEDYSLTDNCSGQRHIRKGERNTMIINFFHK